MPSGLDEFKWSACAITSRVILSLLLINSFSYGFPVLEGQLVGEGGVGVGRTVSIDGDRAVIGYLYDDALGWDSGAARVFHWDGSQWNQETKLVASDGEEVNYFGCSVSLDGDWMVIGAERNDSRTTYSGAAYVFGWDGNAWIEEAKLIPLDGVQNGYFGHEVAIDGDRIAVTAGSNDQGVPAGLVYVFRREGDSWVKEAQLIPSDGEGGDNFGCSISLDGDRLVVGSRWDDDLGNASGSVYVFRRNGDSWTEEAKLLPADGKGMDMFGQSVSLDGDRLAIGCSIVRSTGAYVFRWDGSGWVEEAKLLPSDGIYTNGFGSPVSLYGNRVAVGDHGDNDLASGSGGVYVFGWDGEGWVEETKLKPTASAGASFGYWISLNENRVLASAYQEGTAYVFRFPLLAAPLAAPSVNVWIPNITTAYDRPLTLPIQVDEIQGRNIVSAEVFVAYDGDLLTAISSGPSGTLLTDDWTVETNIVQGIGTTIDTIKMAMATDDDVLSGAGTLIDVLFQVADIRHPASSPLTLTHVLFNDGTPTATPTDGSVTLVGTNAVITSQPSEILPRWSIGVSVYDIDEDRNTETRDAFDVGVSDGGQTETLTVIETGNSTGTFSGTIGTAFSLGFTSNDGIIQAKAGDQIVFSYADSLDSNGDTQMRTAATDVLGGTDGVIRATVVSQPGDTVRVRVSDADLSDAVAVSVANPRTGETESILLSQFTSGESHFYGRFFTEAQAGAVGDSTLEVAKGDTLVVTYADTLTENGGTADVTDDDEVIDPFGDAHPNGSVQAFDAAQVLIHRLSTYGGGAGTLSGLDSLSANVDQGAPFGIIDGYDASLILRKVVGLISRFEVQEPDAVNHPQPETELRPKPVPVERELALVPGEGYVSVWLEDREEIVSGELTLAGVQGQVVMGEELQAFLSASQATEDGLQVVFAGSEAVSGPGELLRVAGVGPGEAQQFTRVSFNGGRIGARWEEEAASVVVPTAFALYPNVPNPFNPETTIRFALARESQVQLEVFDVVGQKVRTLVAERLPAGTHQALWDGRGESGELVGSGIYFCRLQAQHEAGEFRQVRRMLLLK